MPRVSVILPSYNRSQSVGLAVESVLKQSFRDFELCVVDDGSEDDTVEILDSIPGSFHTLRLKENAGVSHAISPDTTERCSGKQLFLPWDR